MATCWMGWRSVPNRPWRASTRNCVRSIVENLRDRHPAYLRSRLSLTEFGKAIVAHKEDFSRHNPIDRWWGGTHLTNDNLWLDSGFDAPHRRTVNRRPWSPRG